MIKPGYEVVQLMPDNHVDDHIDEEIKRCFSEDKPKSFFMFAGAGSGKTRSLINALSFLEKTMGKDLSVSSKQIAVITYTNAARDEISRRLQYKPVFFISTIHSFLWDLIKSHQHDIRHWLTRSIKEEIAELQEKQGKGRKGSAAEKKRTEDIQRKTERLSKINALRRFSYNPNGDSTGDDSLNHSEVVKIGSEFIATEETMQEILVGKYPILLIDESQDTKRELVDALFAVHEKHKGRFLIGMFGDTMQKIYMDGKENLSKSIPDDWVKPTKVMNHRSATRIVDLANAVRSTVDNQPQRPRLDADTGIVRLFIASETSDKEIVELQAAKIMGKVTGDKNWFDESAYKSLILEHRMAAIRLGFLNLYEPLNGSKVFDTSLRDGSIEGLSLLSKIVCPLVKAHKEDNDFEIARIVRQYSPLLDTEAFAAHTDQTGALRETADAVNNLMSLWDGDSVPSCLDILRSIQSTNLFKLSRFVRDVLEDSAESTDDIKVAALRKAIRAPFTELQTYSAYVADNTRFSTHQGVKGLEFPRVMLIMDDSSSRGRWFSYEKLFGAKGKSPTDLENEREGKDTSILRTTRLFYVACTRAQESLAVVAYTEDVEAVKRTAIENGWFFSEEIVLL